MSPIKTLVAGCEQMLMQNDFDSAVYEVKHYLKTRSKLLTVQLVGAGLYVDEEAVTRFLIGETDELSS